MAASPSRAIASVLSGTLGVLLILIAVLLGYVTRSVFNERAFASRVAASLEDPRFSDYVAEQIADALIKAKPDLVGLRPVLIGATNGVVASPPFRAAVRRSARLMHHAILSGAGTDIVLSVKDLDVLLESLSATHPDLARKIPRQITAALGGLASLPGGERGARLLRLANRMRAGFLVLLLLGIASCSLCVGLSRDKRRVIVRLGVALAVIALVLALVARFGGAGLALFARHGQNGPAVAGLGGAFLGGLMQWAVFLGFAGLVMAAAAASLLERVPLRPWGAGLWRWFTGPQGRMRLRLLRGIVGASIGAALIMWPLPSLTVSAWILGLVVGFAGLREGFVAALHLLPDFDRTTAAGRPSRRGRMALAGTLAAILLAVGAWLVLRPNAAPVSAEEVVACNGSPTLCDRTLDQVVFPTSHNSMGGADVDGWMFPNQNAGIDKQLADGVRGFLIDAHYAVPVGDKVKTDLQDETAAMKKYNSALGPEGMEAVLRIRDRMAGQKQGERGIYMCHGFCELGALELVPELRRVRDFLVANPGEVLILVIQDESVTPPDIAHCFEESGLIDFVYRGPARPPWPTLREMVETDQRVLVMAENATAGVDWYHPAFEVLQETPYEFHAPSQFSNTPNRGGTGGSLYLLNHWIETTPSPKPSNAAIVNAHDALLARIDDFTRRRKHLPNLVAVDFYGTGDLIQVVREVNERPLPVAKPGRGARRAGS